MEQHEIRDTNEADIEVDLEEIQNAFIRENLRIFLAESTEQGERRAAEGRDL